MASDLWQRIRAARRYAQKTQEQLAADVGVSKAAISLWEARTPAHRTTPTRENLSALSKATGAPLHFLIDDNMAVDALWYEDVEADRAGDAAGMSIDAREVAAAFDTLPVEIRRQAKGAVLGVIGGLFASANSGAIDTDAKKYVHGIAEALKSD